MSTHEPQASASIETECFSTIYIFFLNQIKLLFKYENYKKWFYVMMNYLMSFRMIPNKFILPWFHFWHLFWIGSCQNFALFSPSAELRLQSPHSVLLTSSHLHCLAPSLSARKFKVEKKLKCENSSVEFCISLFPLQGPLSQLSE